VRMIAVVLYGRGNICKLWDNLICKDNRLAWAMPGQDEAIIDLCEKYHCEFVVIGDLGMSVDYSVIGLARWRHYDSEHIETIELRFEDDEDAIIFKLRFE
jgi:hypothetical protein